MSEDITLSMDYKLRIRVSLLLLLEVLLYSSIRSGGTRVHEK